MMRPAFASTRQAGAFAALLFVLLLLPVLLTQSWLPPREQIYTWSGWDATGPHPYHHRVLFEEKGDIDIVFMGSSHMKDDIDASYVQDQLNKKLGRQAIVRSICWGGPGFDELYLVTKDLLQNRRVKMIVFYDECNPDDQPNIFAPDMFRFADDAGMLAQLSLQLKMAYYYAGILGTPKNLLNLLRSSLPADMSPAKMNDVEERLHYGDIVKQLGSISVRLGFHSSASQPYSLFVPYIPDTRIEPSDVVIYSPETESQFQFSDPPLPAWQLRFGQKFAALAQQYGVKLVLLHFPTIPDMRSPVIKEREFWPKALQADISMVGIPSALLFRGLTDDEVQRLYADSGHLNKNGQDYYTPLITPPLLKIYASETTH